MRIYTKFEQKLINELVKISTNELPIIHSMGDILGDYFTDKQTKRRLLVFENGKLLICTNKNSVMPISFYIEAILLVHELKNNQLIFLQKSSITPPNGNCIGNSVENRSISDIENEYTQKMALPFEINEILSEISKSHLIYVSNNLKSLVENKFKSYEMLQLEEARKQTKTANKTLIWAIVAVVVSIFAPILINSFVGK